VAALGSGKALKWLLLLIGLALLATQLVSWSKLGFDLLRFNVLCSCVLVFLLWRKRRSVLLESGGAPTLFGLVLIGFVLWKSLSPQGNLFDSSLSPLLSGLGIALLASGFKGLRQYWQEFAILFFLPVPFLLRLVVADLVGFKLSAATALAATGIVQLLGWRCSAQDVYIMTPGGMVAVFEGCSGTHAMFFLFALAIVLLVLFPTSGRIPGLIAPLAAIGIAFFVNAFRVALLIILVSGSKHAAFNYWHSGVGGLLFESTAAVIYVLFYRFILLDWKPRRPAAGDSHPNEALG